MRKIVYICDHCGKEIQGEVTAVAFVRGLDPDDASDPEWPLLCDAPTVCAECLKKINDFINNIPGRKEVEAAAKRPPVAIVKDLGEPRKRRPPDTRIDLNMHKILEMKERGVSVVEIATIMHVSEQTIRNRLKEIKEAEQ